MRLSELLKTKTKGKKRAGRGIGSKKGKTAGRGTKGQKARGKIPIGFTGAGLATFKKLPLRRGLGNIKVSQKLKPLALSRLNVFKNRSIVDLEQLLKMNLISKKDVKTGIKIMSDGELKLTLIVRLPVSKKARMKIEKRGGKVENV